uniref:LIM zinc-binding domain-containing protein n=1 Tax=Nothoprocta perdicaria TaxID=30464 RepID=A0A8C6Z7Y0_NOTPE
SAQPSNGFYSIASHPLGGIPRSLTQVIKLHFLLFLQQMLKEVCTSCLQPVYSRERVASDKVCLHHSCFCCQVCRKKLSLQNYAALHGVFYCQLHYKQMIEMKILLDTGCLAMQWRKIEAPKVPWSLKEKILDGEGDRALEQVAK